MLLEELPHRMANSRCDTLRLDTASQLNLPKPKPIAPLTRLCSVRGYGEHVYQEEEGGEEGEGDVAKMVCYAFRPEILIPVLKFRGVICEAVVRLPCRI